jgi:hypothetical protein
MIEFHPLANVFPLIEAAEFEAFVDDVREHGLAEKIVMHEDNILDGRNRYRALAQIGLTDEEILRAHTEPLDDGTDPLAFVISKNLKRRHLDESQRAMVAARLATLQDGQRQVGRLAHVPTQEQAGELLNVSERSIKRARTVLNHGTNELRQAVDRGEVSVSAAAEVAIRPVEQQRELIAGGEKEIIAAARKVRRKIAKAPQTLPAENGDKPTPEPRAPARHLVPIDFERVEQAIDVLHSRWTALAYRTIQGTDSVRMVKNIHDRAAGLEMRYHHAHNAECERICREIRLQAACKGGELLIDMEQTGLRTNGRARKGFKVGAPLDRTTLAALGVAKEESRRWQRLARMSKAEFAALLAGKPARRHMPYRRHRTRRFRRAA